jgi:hypothetical protein
MTIKPEPFPTVPGLTDFLTRMIAERVREDEDRLSKKTANHSLLLQSSGGKVYEITVSDVGALVITLVAG